MARIVGGHDASIRLHAGGRASRSSAPSGRSGRKFGRWLDVVVMQKLLVARLAGVAADRDRRGVAPRRAAGRGRVVSTARQGRADRAGRGRRRPPASRCARFVNPKRVPQMADAEAVLGRPRPRRPDGHLHRARPQRAGPRPGDRRPACGRSTPWSSAPTPSASATRAPPSTSRSTRSPRSPRAPTTPASAPTATVSVAFGCPYEGEVAVDAGGRRRPPGRRGRRRRGGASPTPSACAVPTDVTARVDAVRRAAVGDVPLRAHFHDTRHTGVANVVRRRRGRRRDASTRPRRRRRLPVRARRHRQRRHRGRRVPAAPHGPRHRPRPRRAHRRGAVDRGARSASGSRACSARPARSPAADISGPAQSNRSTTTASTAPSPA